MYLTNYAERAFLNTFLGITWAAPITIYVGLFLSNPTDTGTSGVEISYTGYQRQMVNFGEPVSVLKTTTIKNTNSIIFPKSNKEVGTITYAGYFDAQIGGNMLAYAQLTESMAVGIDEAPTILIEEISLAFTQDLSQAYKRKLLSIFRGISVPGFNPYIALFRGDPDTGGAEISGPQYARQRLNFTTPTEGLTGYSEISLNEQVIFPKPPEEWGIMNHLVIYDAEINGEPVYSKARTTDVTLKKGHTIIFQSGAIKVSVN